MAALRVRVELARSHVFDHTLTKRTDSVGLAHRALLPELRLNDPRFSGRSCPSRHRYPIRLLPALPAHAPRASGPERSDFVPLRSSSVTPTALANLRGGCANLDRSISGFSA